MVEHGGERSSVDHRMQLNNYMQHIYRNQSVLCWQTQQTGTEHQWEATALINGVEYGRATASLLDDAKEGAARQALAALRGD